MYVLDAEQMQAADRHAIDEIGLPSLVLMENAGTEVARVIEESVGSLPDVSVLILCGKGNNGGDGLVVARKLAARGTQVRAVLLGDPDELSGDAAVQWEVLRHLGVPAQSCGPREWHEVRETLQDTDLVVDALLGTGFRGVLEGFLAEVVEDLNATDVPVIAVDVPSGLSGSSADVPGPAVEATCTVTFAAPKVCHVFAPTHELCGDLVVADIGIPERSLEAAGANVMLLEDELIGELIAELADRPEDSHKGSWGHVVIVGGAVGRSGAPAMAGLGALTAGCGLATVATPAACVDAVASHAPELMQLPLPTSATGEVGVKDVPVDEILARADVLVVGPGLGTGEGARDLLWRLLDDAEVPLVLDADALNLLADADELPGSSESRPLVLTPHPGEFARLIRGREGADRVTRMGQPERLPLVRDLAEQWDAIVVLKSFRTLVVAPGEDVLVNPTGGPGLATAGVGDVLSGFIGGLAAQGLSAWAAAVAGTWLHGRAGDLAEEERGQMALLATDLLRSWPAAVRSVLADELDEDERP